MFESTIELLIVALIVILSLFVILKYTQLKGEIETRARTLHESWKGEEMEKQVTEKANLIFKEWKFSEEKNIRQDAIKKSQAVTMGKFTEHIIPYFPDFHYNPKDVRFLGNPIDLIVFDGLYEGNLKKVAFVEVKSGKTGNLSKREREIRDCINERNVSFETLHYNNNEL